MNSAVEVVQAAYAAFGRGDIPDLLRYLADEVDWECAGPKSLAYTGNRRGPDQVVDFFAAVARLEQIHEFDPREFIVANEHVTVLGRERTTALDTHKTFTTEWVHVFTVKNAKITRWRGFFDTAARYGL